MRNVKVRAIAALSMTAISVSLHAETQAQAATVGDLARVQADRIMFIGKAALLDAEANYQSKLPASGAGAGVERSVDVPTLTRLMGVNGIVFGSFQYADGQTVERAVGDKIPGDYTIVHLWPEKASGELRDKHGKIIAVGSSQVGVSAPVPAVATAAPLMATPLPPAIAFGQATPSGAVVPSINGVQR
ncbi:exported hypothetical protein [Paraburkholderia tropica]|uniref:hypothetical protein n=1 Tax=Paraburkholderia tropica TaxID=92647 RepID=UPI001CB49EE9|nr:hypothetical protein [Paraburkholderia tropica]CAG9230018.1 exported hypothetical protein [Paraburkholderia tropica]